MRSIVLRSAHWKSSMTNRTGSSHDTATHQVGDRFEEQPPARLRIDHVRESATHPRERRGSARGGRCPLRGPRRARSAPSIGAAATYWSTAAGNGPYGVLTLLVARAEEHSPVLSVRHSATAATTLVLPAPGSPAEARSRLPRPPRCRAAWMRSVRSSRPTNTGGKATVEGRRARVPRLEGPGAPSEGNAAVVDQLVDPLELLGAAQHLATKEDELGALGKSVFDEPGGGAREQHLSADGERPAPRAARLTVCP